MSITLIAQILDGSDSRLRTRITMHDSRLDEIKFWLTAYLVKLLASIGAVLGLLSIYRIAIQDSFFEGNIMLLPSIAVLVFPIFALLRERLSMAVQMAAISAMLVLTVSTMVLHKGLASNFLLLAPLLMLSQVIFYGQRGFVICLWFLVIIIAVAMLLDIKSGYILIDIQSTQGMVMRGLTISLITGLSCFAFRGVYLTYQMTDHLLNKQAITIEKQKINIGESHERAETASQNLVLLENTLNCLVLIINFDGTVSFQNKYAINLLVHQKKGDSVFDIIVDEDSSLALSGALSLAAAGEDIESFPFTVTDHNGDILNFIAACAPRRNLSGLPLDMVCAATDVTELQKERSRLRNLNKLEAVGLACARIAHDFANLLLVIQGNLVLLDKERLNPDEKTFLADATKAVQASELLTKQIGRFASSPQINLNETKLVDFMSEMHNNAEKICPRRVRIMADWSFTNESIDIDDTQLNVIILNLVANSRDAISGEGNITIRARLDQSSEVENPQFCLDVIDSGHGISQENLEKVTEPFFTTKTLTSGLGLGLSTSRRLVEEMGGTLKIFSEKGSGTTVSLVLPVNSMSA